MNTVASMLAAEAGERAIVSFEDAAAKLRAAKAELDLFEDNYSDKRAQWVEEIEAELVAKEQKVSDAAVTRWLRGHKPYQDAQSHRRDLQRKVFEAEDHKVACRLRAELAIVLAGGGPKNGG